MNESTELHSIRDFIRFATSRFNEAELYYGHGTDNAWDEALMLILDTLHLPFDKLPFVLDAKLTESEKDTLLALIDLRIHERTPVPYLTNKAWFASLPFYVDERVLIPRSSLAEHIENQFMPWVKPETVHHILDLCTGSGCIAIATAYAFPEAEIDASDISEEALAVAEINVTQHELADHIHLKQADLFTGLANKSYDIIISNPPYVDAEDMATLPEEYHHEPVLGLASGKDGLDAVHKILKEAKNYLSHEGVLIVEVGNSETALQAAYPKVPFTWLTCERGEGGVFLLTANQLRQHF